MMSVAATLFEERSTLSPTSISFWQNSNPCHGSFLSHTSLSYRRSMRSCPFPHHGDFVFGSLDHRGLWHWWNFKQSQRSLLDMGTTIHDLCSNRPTTLLLVWGSLSLYCKVACIQQIRRHLTLVMNNWMLAPGGGGKGSRTRTHWLYVTSKPEIHKLLYLSCFFGHQMIFVILYPAPHHDREKLRIPVPRGWFHSAFRF